MDIAVIVQALTVAAQLLPAVAEVISSHTASEADAGAVYAATQALEAQVAIRGSGDVSWTCILPRSEHV